MNMIVATCICFQGAQAGASNMSDESKFILMSWNLDGLDPVSLGVRTKKATDAIKASKADVIFLQELVASTWEQIKIIMNADYHMISAPICQYFTGVLLKKATVTVGSIDLIPFETTQMMRNLQVIDASVKGLDVKLMNTHLESTQQHSDERVKQLKIAMEEMVNADPTLDVIFGGDTNLGGRDFNNLQFPPNVDDIWEMLGCNPETRYTWDTQTNNNKKMMGPGRPRCRFDRLYLRKSEMIAPLSFSLSGFERVPNGDRFPSDHWAIIVEFGITALMQD